MFPNFLMQLLPLSSLVAHDVVQVISNELISFTYGREESLVQHDGAHADVQSSPPIDHTMVWSIPTDVGKLSQVTMTHVATSEDSNRVLVLHEEDIDDNPNIQRDMELWCRIHDYDKKEAEMPFTLDLSKKQKQHIKEQLQIGKPPYKTRSKGDASPTAQ